mgnify:CR=1 FL=1
MKHLMIFAAALLMLVGTNSFAQASLNGYTAVGKWKTIDDETKKPKSIVEIYEKDGKYYGKILELFREPSEEQDPVCEECTDHRKDAKIIGMEIISDMKQDKNDYSSGTILDPAKGSIYTCKFWLEDENTLKLRGYLYFLYRTQTWHRVAE